MPNIGDRVLVTISGGGSGTSIAKQVVVQPGRKVELAGKIIEVLSDSYVVELDSAFDGKNRIRVSKSGQMVS